MSTNPFDDTHFGTVGGSRQGGLMQQSIGGARHGSGLGPGTPSGGTERTRNAEKELAATTTGGISSSSSTAVPPIWNARGVEWPLPSHLNEREYNRLNRASQLAGSHLGIAEVDGRDDPGGTSGTGGRGNAATAGNGVGEADGKSGAAGTPKVQDGEGGYIAGLVGRWTGTGTSVAGADSGSSSGSAVAMTSGKDKVRPVHAPAPRCVAAANGWIVAVVDCPPLRLISRWNVRRGTSSATTPAELLVPLPPPVLVSTVAGGSASSGTSYGTQALSPSLQSTTSIAHVFVDPTGCHVLISARNGEAYYLHSTATKARKLVGFGPNPDGTPSCKVGSADNTVNRGEERQQLGLSTGSYVTAVGWDRVSGTEGSTKKIFLGTSSGEIFQYSLISPTLDGSGDAVGSQNDSERYPALLHRFDSSVGSSLRDHANDSTTVSGIHFDTGDVVLVVTSGASKRTRLHTFRANPEMLAMASSSSSAVMPAFSQAEGCQSSFIELPGSLPYAELQVCSDDISVTTETGLYYQSLHLKSLLSAGASAESGLLSYRGILPGGYAPTSTALTPNHFVLLNGGNDEVKFVDRVARKLVQVQTVDWLSLARLSSDDNLQIGAAELILDPRRPNQVWLRKSKTLVHISSSCESRDAWLYTLQQCLADVDSLSGVSAQRDALFDRATSLCSNNIQKATVAAARAEFHMLLGKTEVATKLMAESSPALMPFDKKGAALVLQGLRVPSEQFFSYHAQKDIGQCQVALLSYLTDKIRLAKLKDDEVIYSMIAAWIAEVQLHELSRHHGENTSDNVVRQAYTSRPSGRSALLHRFRAIHPCASAIDSNIITQNIVRSHDIDASEFSALFEASGDVGTAVGAALSANPGETGALNAMRVLDESNFENAEPYYYKFAFAILCRAPKVAAKSLLARYSDGLCPSKLLPSFMRYDRKRKESRCGPLGTIKGGDDRGPPRDVIDNEGAEGASVDYLEGVISLGCRSTAVYNYLILLYAAMEDEVPLYRFLSTHVSSGVHGSRGSQGQNCSPLDMSYALRVVLKTGRHFRSAVKLYVGFGMREKAVELAIMVDPTVARELTKDRISIEEQKRLWLMIARNAAEGGTCSDGNDVVASVASVLNECGPDILSIEDVLPFLPDFAQIDQIQKDICRALTTYSSKIDRCMGKMDEDEGLCQGLREELHRLEESSVTTSNTATCASSRRPLQPENEAYYVFPSGYVFQANVLMDLMKPHLNEEQINRVDSITAEIGKIRNKLRSLPSDIEVSRLESLHGELDGLIAAECPLTGAVMVESVDKPFSPP